MDAPLELQKCGHWSRSPCMTCANDKANMIYANMRAELYKYARVHFSYLMTSEMLEIFNKLRNRNFIKEHDYVFNFVYLTDTTLIALDTHFNRNKDQLIKTLGGTYLIISYGNIVISAKNVARYLHPQDKKQRRAKIINYKPIARLAKSDILSSGTISECALLIEDSMYKKYIEPRPLQPPPVKGAAEPARKSAPAKYALENKIAPSERQRASIGYKLPKSVNRLTGKLFKIPL